MSELKTLSVCSKAIEKLDEAARHRVVSYLVARYTPEGRISIKMAVELAASVGDQQRARDVRKQVLEDLISGNIEPPMSGHQDVDTSQDDDPEIE